MTTCTRLLGSLALLLLASCAVAEDPVGALELELTAPGPDGSTYRLVEGTMLRIQGASFFDDVSLDGDQAVRRVNLPPGNYQVSLFQGGDVQTTVALLRDDGAGTITVVHGTMVGPSPIPVTVIQAEVMPLVITFEVPRARPVTFGRGHLDVSVAIDEQDATGSNANMYGVLTDAAIVTVGAALPVELAATLPADGSTSTEVAVAIRLTGPWALLSTNRACAPGTLAGWGSSFAGLAAMLEEYRNGAPTINVCVMAFPGLTAFSIELSEIGAPETPAFQGLGPEEIFFANQLLAHMPEGIFDGETIDLEALSVPQVHWAFFQASVTDPLDGSIHYDLEQSGTLAVHVVPEL
jgi:hypothetical protein